MASRKILMATVLTHPIKREGAVPEVICVNKFILRSSALKEYGGERMWFTKSEGVCGKFLQLLDV